METFLQILQWLVPAGGVGTVLVWLTSSRIRDARTAREVHDTYKLMYEDVQNTLIQIQNENSKLHEAVARLESTLSRATRCVHYGVCPIRGELQKLAEGKRKLLRTSTREEDGRHRPRDAYTNNTEGESRHGDLEPESAEPP